MCFWYGNSSSIRPFTMMQKLDPCGVLLGHGWKRWEAQHRQQYLPEAPTFVISGWGAGHGWGEGQGWGSEGFRVENGEGSGMEGGGGFRHAQACTLFLNLTQPFPLLAWSRGDHRPPEGPCKNKGNYFSLALSGLQISLLLVDAAHILYMQQHCCQWWGIGLGNELDWGGRGCAFIHETIDPREDLTPRRCREGIAPGNQL